MSDAARRRATSRIEATIAIVAGLWVAALAAAPRLPVVAAAVLYAAGSFICHQIPERSFHLNGFQLPVCARCFGLYVGAALGSVVAAAVAGRASVRAVMNRRVAITLVAAIPTLATVVLEWGLGWPVSNAFRAVAAAVLASVATFVVLACRAAGASNQHWPQRGGAVAS